MQLALFCAGCVVSLVIAWWAGRMLFGRRRDNVNPLEWPLIDRCLLVLSLYFVLGGVTGLTGAVRNLFRVGHVPWINYDFWNVFLPAYVVFVAILLILYPINIHLRKRQADSLVFMHVIVQFTALTTAFVCYVFGPISDPKGFLIGMSQAALCFILFGHRASMGWVLTYMGVLVGLMASVWAGYLPYGPFYITDPALAERLQGTYWVAMLAQNLLIFLLLFFITAFIVAAWRDKEKRLADMSDLLKKMFGRYLSAEVMKSLLDDPLAMEMGGKRQDVTIMMTDLRGFTSMSERLEPELVVQALNAYFEVMVEVILKYKGTINEIIGDALVVIFGAPQEMEESAATAAACAIEMQNVMERVNRINMDQGLPELEMGIGLNKAEVVVGNIGSSKRSSYTAIGSGVNMASRIESYTVGGQVLISESVFREVRHLVRVDGMREVTPKGTEQVIRIYDVGGIAGTYNLFLDQKAQSLTPLLKTIPVRSFAVEGKHAGRLAVEGRIVGLSRHGAEIDFAEDQPLMANLKLHLADVYEELGQKAFYAKVTAHSVGGNKRALCRFTAVPPEVFAYLQAHLTHAS